MKQIIIILCLCIMTLTGCTLKEEVEEGKEFNIETDFQLEYCDMTYEPHPIVEVNDGYYILVGYYIYYVDKETMEYTPLCNKANCLHQKETDQMKTTNCNAMVRAGVRFYLTLNYYKEHLYVPAIVTVSGENGLPESRYVMEKLALDGGNREVIHKFEKPVEMAITHRGYIYYSSARDSLGSELAGVYRVPIDGGKEELLYTAKSKQSQITQLRIINNALVFTEYGDPDIDLWSYDLTKQELKQVSFGEGVNVTRAGVANERIYYWVIDEDGWNIRSTKMDGSDVKKETFLSDHEDKDYYYLKNEEDNTQNVYEWGTNNKITTFSQLTIGGSFFTGTEKLFWYCSNDNGGIKVSYINREDIPEGDSAVKVLMDLSESEVHPGIITVNE